MKIIIWMGSQQATRPTAATMAPMIRSIRAVDRFSAGERVTPAPLRALDAVSFFSGMLPDRGGACTRCFCPSLLKSFMRSSTRAMGHAPITNSTIMSGQPQSVFFFWEATPYSPFFFSLC